MPQRPTIVRTTNPTANEWCGIACAIVFFGVFILIGSTVSLFFLLGMPGFAKLIGLFPLMFVGIGAVGIWAMIRSMSLTSRRTAALGFRRHSTPEIETDLPIPKLRTYMGRDLPVRLGMETSQKASVFVILFASVFWNGIVGVFVYIGLFTSAFPWFVWIFLSPFILIGTFLAIALLKQILVALRVPDTIVEFKQEPVQPGETVTVLISQSGNLYLERLEIHATCHEKISYTRGTDTYNEDRQIWSEPIFVGTGIEISNARSWREMVDLAIPADAMHSFHSDHNEVVWKITVKGIVRGWPDFDFTFPFRVMPQGVREKVSWKRESLSA